MVRAVEDEAGAKVGIDLSFVFAGQLQLTASRDWGGRAAIVLPLNVGMIQRYD
jgi:hypothetical protein